MSDVLIRKLRLSLEAAGVTDEDAALLMSAIDDAGLALTDGKRVACSVTETLPSSRKAIAGLHGVYIVEVEDRGEVIRLLEQRSNPQNKIRLLC